MDYGLTEIRRAPAPPFAPQGLTATAASASEIDLACDASPLAQRYEFQRSANGISGWSTVARVTAPSYANTGLTALTEYFYRARGVNAAGSGPWSAVASATTDTIHPLLDLAAGWALTAGPQQTLSSAGVVTSGHDLIASGIVTYGADGAVGGGSGAELDYNDVGGSLFGASKSDSYLICYRVNPAHDDDIYDVAAYAASFGNPYELLTTSGADHALQLTIQDDAGAITGPATTPSGIVNGTASVLLGWYDAGTGVIGRQVDDNAPVSRVVTATVPGQPTPLPPDWALTRGTVGLYVQLAGSTFGGSLGLIRIWIGPNAATLAADASFRTWLAGGGAGRSDAELAAYTP